MLSTPATAARILAGLALCVSAVAQTQPSGSGGGARVDVTLNLDPKVDEILTRIEQREIQDLRARLRWQMEYALTEDKETKLGEIWYKDEEPVGQFKVRFESRVREGRKDRLSEEHLFDGNWYIEKRDEPSKTITRREVRAKDDPRDPFKLGEGAFPLPFGQTKQSILREFDVELRDTRERDPEGTEKLRLTPRENTHTGQDYAWLEFWVAREGRQAGLPVQVRAAKLDGTGTVNSYITVHFTDAELNTGFASSVFRIDTPPGYEEIVEPLGQTTPLPTP